VYIRRNKVIKNFLIFILISLIFGFGVYRCVRYDVNMAISNIQENRKASLELDYQAYTKPEDKK
jgi:hypothetical protein